jgi:DNA polymerase I
MDKIFLVDASGFIYRSYFAIQNLTNSKGESTNGLYGFIRSILKLMKDFQPTHLVSVFDGPQSTLKRSEIYPDYKAHRKEMPKDLVHQIVWARQFCRLMGIPEMALTGVEADDTMGSIATWAAIEGAEVFLCTSDKDFCQLVNKKIKILNTHKDNLILDEEGVFKQFGVRPDQIIDYLAITGDASDNVPGLPGFGPKTAADLLNAFGNLEYILDHPAEVPGKKKQEILVQHRETALLSKQLVTIDIHVPFTLDPSLYQLAPPQPSELKTFYTEMNFTSLIKEMKSSDPSPATEIVDYRCIDDEESLKNLVLYLEKFSEIAIDVEATHIRPLQAKLVGIGLGVTPGQAWYIPVNGQLGLDKAISLLNPLFKNPSIGFYGHHIKYDLHVLANHGIHLSRVSFDTILASYLLNAHSRQHSLDYLSFELFGKVKTPIEYLIGKGKKQINMSEVPIDKVTAYCCEDVDYTIRIKHIFAPQLIERGLYPLLNDLELPLMFVLLKMERHGIYVDCAYLKQLGIEVAIELRRLESDIYELAGEEFNINSPKQLSEILFTKLGITPPKKTATGFSTNAEVLQGLKHPLADKMLEYRGLEKLRSTYIESLPNEIDPKTGRIHCSFNQVVAATGRLSCQDPNLQNIPVRSPVGKKIRHAFQAKEEEWSFIAADYSQIELRLLAHLSGDPVLTAAFRNHEDVHRSTAAAMFEIPLEQVTPEQRYQAKAINFGIIYGQQAFGLSQELNISVKTASNFIDAYFRRYGKIKEFLERSKEEVRKTGRAVTPTGRQRLIPEITSSNSIIRSAAERLAVNTPLQGMAADLIKMAMIEMDKQIQLMNFKGSMILQIHDELIFEAPDDELEAFSVIIKKVMEEVMHLTVPLVVDIHIAKNWEEC